MDKMLIRDLTWPELAAEMENIKVAIVPVGSCEQHGPNTSFATDAARANGMSELLAERCGNKVVVYPPVNYGISLHHMVFPGTVTLHPDTMIDWLVDIGVSIAKHGIKKILFVNSHGGNYSVLDAAIINLRQDHGIDAYWTPIGSEISKGDFEDVPEFIGHGCEVETSSCMYLCPEVVKENREAGIVQDSIVTTSWMKKGGFSWDWRHDATLNGALGDARRASYEHGKAMSEEALDYIAKLIEEIIKRP